MKITDTDKKILIAIEKYSAKKSGNTDLARIAKLERTVLRQRKKIKSLEETIKRIYDRLPEQKSGLLRNHNAWQSAIEAAAQLVEKYPECAHIPVRSLMK